MHCRAKAAVQKPFANLKWSTNATLQLQRLAHKALDAGIWEGACNDYPKTRKGDLLACLDISDPAHPVLQATKTTDAASEQRPTEDSEDENDIESGVTLEPTDDFLLIHEIPHSSLELDQRFASNV